MRTPGLIPPGVPRSRTRGRGRRWSRSCCGTPCCPAVDVVTAGTAVFVAAFGTTSAAALPSFSPVLSFFGIPLQPVDMNIYK